MPAKCILPFGLLPVGLLPGWLLPQSGGYLVYRGEGDAAHIDWQSAVAGSCAGQTALQVRGLTHTAETAYWYGVRAVSDGGAVETNTTRVCRAMVDGEGALVDMPPAALIHARAHATAGGKVAVSFRYDAPAAGFGEATGVQVAPLAAGKPDWDHPLETVAIAGDARVEDHELADAHDHGQLVELAVRAVTAGGVGGPARIVRAGADALGPAASPYATAAQVSE